MSPYLVFALGGILSGPLWLFLAALLTTAKRADEEAEETYHRIAEAQAKDHQALHGFQAIARWE